MSFDKGNESPDQMVNPQKKTTKVNMGVVLGVVAFIAIGSLVMCSVDRDPQQEPPSVSPIP